MDTVAFITVDVGGVVGVPPAMQPKYPEFVPVPDSQKIHVDP